MPRRCLVGADVLAGGGVAFGVISSFSPPCRFSLSLFVTARLRPINESIIEKKCRTAT